VPLDVPTMRMEFADGRNFEPFMATDSLDAWIVNEAAVRKFGWTETLGKGFQFGTGRRGQIVGVVKDFHFASLRQPVNPLVIKMNPFWYEFMAVRVRQNEVSSAIAFLQETWRNFVPDRPLVHFFLDEDLDKLYQAENRLGQVFRSFAMFASVIACLGLFGLAAFTSEQRTKEIGIRKVLGATEHGILLLFSRDFIKLVLLANLVAWPIAYFVMSRWLDDFAYRIDLSWTVFITAGTIALLIAILTVSYQAIKAAVANPVESLRYE
jgi:putative ABC transport system permease protein